MNFINEFLIILVMFTINAVVTAYEMALASISRTTLTYLVQIKEKGAAEALFMKDRMEASLSTTQLGITLTGAIAAAIAGAGVTQTLNPFLQKVLGLSQEWAEVLSLVALIVPFSGLMIIFTELIPKIFAIRNSELVVLKLSGIMKYFSTIAYPIISTLEKISKKAVLLIGNIIPYKRPGADTQSSLHELKTALSLAKASRLIGAQQERIAMSAAHLSLRPIKDIMIEAPDICMIAQQCSLSEALIQAHRDMHTRFPVCQNPNDWQSIIGYINFKDIVAALKINPEDPSVKGIVRPIKKFLDTAAISGVLEKMIQEKLHIGLIEDAQGHVTGLITQEDIIEELVGEIEDEYDRLPTYIYPYTNQWLIGGAVSMSKIAQTLSIPWAAMNLKEDIKLADWCLRQCPRGFNSDGIIAANGFQVTIKKLRRKKVSEAFVKKT